MLKPGAYADVIVTDYDPLTPMDGGNVNGHILFGMNGRSVVTTVCNGKVLMKDRKVLVTDEKVVMQECRTSAAKLWKSING
ncbi:putative aminohydrolase SsnA [bioreactor metagenome]|uniref:Putative aminohydrolase SsnA n=1 Tax=bioreactor metagenome TaxID=1076179 RepID=A0A645CK26_9ZZZZ